VSALLDVLERPYDSPEGNGENAKEAGDKIFKYGNSILEIEELQLPLSLSTDLNRVKVLRAGDVSMLPGDQLHAGPAFGGKGELNYHVGLFWSGIPNALSAESDYPYDNQYTVVTMHMEMPSMLYDLLSVQLQSLYIELAVKIFVPFCHYHMTGEAGFFLSEFSDLQTKLTKAKQKGDSKSIEQYTQWQNELKANFANYFLGHTGTEGRPLKITNGGLSTAQLGNVNLNYCSSI